MLYYFYRGMATTVLMLRALQQCWIASCTSFVITGLSVQGSYHAEVSQSWIFFWHLFSFASRFAETDGKGFDRARRYEIGRKHFKLTHFEEVQCYYSSLQSFRNQNPPHSFAWLHLQRVHVPYCLMQVFTTQHWMVRIYKLKPQKNRVRGKLKLKLKSVSQTTLQLAYNHVSVRSKLIDAASVQL